MESGREWFWQNYNICLKWQESHKCAYWKSKALALEYERDALLNYIKIKSENEKYIAKDLNRRPHLLSFAQSSSSDCISTPKRNGRSRYNDRRSSRTFKRPPPHTNKCPSRDENNYMKRGIEVHPAKHPETELDKDVIEFFKKSMIHKMELQERKKASEESDSATDSSVKRRPTAHKSEEMKLLYGDKRAMIQGMETAMQLTFERNCDILNPVVWPVLPLKM